MLGLARLVFEMVRVVLVLGLLLGVVLGCSTVAMPVGLAYVEGGGGAAGEAFRGGVGGWSFLWGGERAERGM